MSFQDTHAMLDVALANLGGASNQGDAAKLIRAAKDSLRDLEAIPAEVPEVVTNIQDELVRLGVL